MAEQPFRLRAAWPGEDENDHLVLDELGNIVGRIYRLFVDCWKLISGSWLIVRKHYRGVMTKQNRRYPDYEPGADAEIEIFGVVTNTVRRFRR